jgi:hypothetical protein
MERPENNKWLDETLTETIGSEKPRTDFEQWKKQHPEAVQMLTSRAKSKTSTTKHPHIIRAKIMKNPFTKLAAAATIVLAAVLSIILLNQTATPAWAIEQTIEALNNIKMVHLAGYAKYPDQPRRAFEIWAMPNSTDRSVSGNFKLIEGDHHISIANEKENITYVYTRHPNGDVVYLTRGLNRGCDPFPTSDLFRQFKQIGSSWKEIYGKDEETGRDCVFVTFVGPSVNTASYWKFQFDMKTKLPIRGGVWWSENYEGEPHFDYTMIEYGCELPEEFFDFDIPEGTQVVDCRELRDLIDENPNCGVSVGEMSTADACTKVVEEYWKAVIDNNWEHIKRIRPPAAGNYLELLQALYNEHQPVEFLNIVGMNHLNDPGTFAEVTCRLKLKDGTTQQSVLNVEIRQTPRDRIGVIAGSIMGKLTETN